MSLFSAIGRFVSEFARFILFFASIIFLIGSTLLLIASSQGRNDLNLVEIEGVHTVLSISVGFSIYLILLSIIGIFASFFSSSSTIKLLAFMTALNVVIGLLVVFTSAPRIDLVHNDLVDQLTKFEGKYDWNHQNGSSSDIKLATRVWDNIQADLQCCGLNDPKEWSHFRPADHQLDNILPKSCCKSDESTKKDGFCHADKADDYYGQNCSDSLKFAFTMIMDMIIFMVCFNLVIFSLAIIVLCCNPHNSHNYNQGAYY